MLSQKKCCYGLRIANMNRKFTKIQTNGTIISNADKKIKMFFTPFYSNKFDYYEQENYYLLKFNEFKKLFIKLMAFI